MNIYVGNIAWSMTEDDLEALFAEHGTVVSANIITDKYSGRSRGFGFVEMEDDAAAEAAIEALNDSEQSGRALKVNQAKPREDRS
ncbi:MAG: RNA-binding protein [Gammaproteobacteria bacterium]|nr:RNA-binding protein [Gammaproteobacteria bacterium]MBT5216247.1 RNA-binding protein [Gammaproteobacteria bacterium]MBT5542009.1 RNA-binding protein [Gammaproteobacteria bacterium]MBT6073969.1 RNA-binding protein [Gammaproteobacteria bacterium]MBT7754410.1 RNA-binding protein [Gammaproteobacteria bacterium]